MIITVQECIDSAEKGWFVILHNGKVLGFTNEKEVMEDDQGGNRTADYGLSERRRW